MALTAFRSKEVALLLLIHCLLLPHCLCVCVGGGSVFNACFYIHYFVSSKLCNQFDGEGGGKKAGCFTLIVLLVLCDC